MTTETEPTHEPQQRSYGAAEQALLQQIQTLAQRVQSMLPAEQGKGRVVGVTGCSRGEGVSTIASMLAASAAELYSGRVLLVDADPRSSTLAARFDVPITPGLAEMTAGLNNYQECISATAWPSLSVLPAGDYRSAGQLSSNAAVEAVKRIRCEFDLIVLDLPPVNDMDEAFPASRCVDGTLFVIEAERVRRPVAQRAKRQLEELGAPLLGVVFNKRRDHIPGWLYHRL